MKRRWLSVLGAGMLLAGAVYVAVFGVVSLAGPFRGTAAVCFTLSAIFEIVAGQGERVGSVEWYQFMGAANVLMGVMIGIHLVGGVVHGSPTPIGLDGMMAVGALSITWIGIDLLRGGRHFDPASYDSGPILGR